MSETGEDVGGETDGGVAVDNNEDDLLAGGNLESGSDSEDGDNLDESKPSDEDNSDDGSSSDNDGNLDDDDNSDDDNCSDDDDNLDDDDSSDDDDNSDDDDSSDDDNCSDDGGTCGLEAGSAASGVDVGFFFLLKKFSMAHKSIRIVGGQYRRTSIPVVEVPGLRPTPDRVRETLFNWLTHLWAGTFNDKVVLDLFAGSGALGFEAASRGVAQVQMIERNQTALAALHALRYKLGATQVHIYGGDALEVLRDAPVTYYDLICLDPPFRQNWLARLWPLLPSKLRPGGLVYIESEAKVAPAKDSLHSLIPTTTLALTPFSIIRQDRAGQVHYQLIQF